MTMSEILPLIDTHTHFDIPEFDTDRVAQAALAYQNGVRDLVLVGYLAKYFERMVDCQAQMQALGDAGKPSPRAHLAFGLHPFYITQHTPNDLRLLEQCIQRYPSVALGEVGLDTFTAEMKLPKNIAKQQAFFIEQLGLATRYKLPVLLHIRRAHAETLKILKQQRFVGGGIAHSFSGGIQEAKALVNLGFKIGVTGQVTNPNAKKLRTTLVELVNVVGINSLVIETDCPDMMPLPCQTGTNQRNVPANLPYVVQGLADLLAVDIEKLSEQLIDNTQQVFGSYIG